MIPSLAAVHPAMPPAEIIARIEEALQRDDTHSWDDVQEMLILGDAQIFWNDHGAWITEIKVAPRKRWLHIWIIAGQLPEVMELQEEVEKFALTHGLSRMISLARPGWLGISDKPGWEKFGWSQHGVVLLHEIEGV